jgi:hypothetical protein
MQPSSKLRLLSACAVMLACSLLASGCGALHQQSDQPSNASGESSSSGGDSGAGEGGSGSRTVPIKDVAMDAPPKLTAPLLSSDVLVYSQDTLSPQIIDSIKNIRTDKGARAISSVETFSMGSFYVDEQEVTYAAVNPATFRRLTPQGTAQTQGVWDRVAGGEIAVSPGIAKKLATKDGFLKLGNETSSPTVHIGAYAQILDPTYAHQIDAVVNSKWVAPLGMKKDNAMIVSMGSTSPQSIRKQLQKDTNGRASVQILGPDFDLSVQTVVPTGGSVAKAVGSFSYTPHADGTVSPDPKWVAAKIRTEEMPIIGRVTGNVVMLPQLRGALNEVVASGLSKSIYQYGGCYVPRFIAGTHTLSFHSFGTAIDLNVADNQRGTVGKMDRRVVAIFYRWGFAWGGTWHYTDPMHFELERIVKSGAEG